MVCTGCGKYWGAWIMRATAFGLLHGKSWEEVDRQWDVARRQHYASSYCTTPSAPSDIAAVYLRLVWKREPREVRRCSRAKTVNRPIAFAPLINATLRG